MVLESTEVINAILNNETSRAAEMLEWVDLLKDVTPLHFTSTDKRLVSTMLGAASVAAWHENLNEDLAQELIERTAMTVDIFPFLRLVVAGTKIENEDFDAIPENIRTALHHNDYTDQIARAIEDLDDDTFGALLAYYITGEIVMVHVKFNLPVIRHIYSEKVIPAGLLFALMASNLQETIDEHFGDRYDALLGTLGNLSDGLGLLGALLDGMHDDDGLHDALGASDGLGLLGAFLDGMLRDDDDDGDDDDDDDDRGGCHGFHSDD